MLRPRWTPPTKDGWYPKVSPTGRYVVYGNAKTQCVDLETGIVTKYLDEPGKFMQSMGWWDAHTFMLRDMDGGLLYLCDAETGAVAPFPVPAGYGYGNDASASAGRWGVVRRVPDRFILNGLIKLPERDSLLLCSVAGHFAVVQDWRAHTLLLWEDGVLVAEFTPQQPNDNEIRVNELGTVSYGYYSTMRLRFRDGTDVNATVTPGKGSESIADMPLLDGEMWLWQGAELGDAGVVIGRDWLVDGVKQAIVLDKFPCVSLTAAWNGNEWVVAGCDAVGAMQVAFVSRNAPRQKLEPVVAFDKFTTENPIRLAIGKAVSNYGSHLTPFDTIILEHEYDRMIEKKQVIAAWKSGPYDGVMYYPAKTVPEFIPGTQTPACVGVMISTEANLPVDEQEWLEACAFADARDVPLYWNQDALLWSSEDARRKVRERPVWPKKFIPVKELYPQKVQGTTGPTKPIADIMASHETDLDWMVTQWAQIGVVFSMYTQWIGNTKIENYALDLVIDLLRRCVKLVQQKFKQTVLGWVFAQDRPSGIISYPVLQEIADALAHSNDGASNPVVEDLVQINPPAVTVDVDNLREMKNGAELVFHDPNNPQLGIKGRVFVKDGGLWVELEVGGHKASTGKFRPVKVCP
jgi:hypothetical protein